MTKDAFAASLAQQAKKITGDRNSFFEQLYTAILLPDSEAIQTLKALQADYF